MGAKLNSAMRDGDPDHLHPEGSREQTRVLVELAKQIGTSRGDLSKTLRQITEAAARTLGVARTGVWLYDDKRTMITCLDLYEAEYGRHSAGLRILARDAPAYFEALESERAIAAHDARTDARTSTFTADYLSPLGIHAMLDAPIRIRGQMIGVVCNEHRGAPRRWTSHEENLSGTFADFVGLAIEAHEHYEQEVKAHRLEAQLRQAQKLESMGLLAGGIAHDFNNLLVGILGNAGLALMELPEEAPLRPLIEDIRDAATRAAELANEMLAYSGRATVASDSVDLNGLVEEMVHLLRRSLAERSTIEVDLDPAGPTALGDATQLRRVVMNLITNAADAVEDRHGTVTVATGRATLPDYDTSDHIFGERLEDGDYVTFTVADDGAGMDSATKDHLFDPFYSTKTNGRGLGLAVVLGIVSSHRGAIMVDSALGRGSQFTILVPASHEPPPPPPPPKVDAASRQRTGTILVADDEAIVRAVTRRVLQREGYAVLEAHDGREAIDRFREHRGELVAVVLDLTMPLVSGREALDAIRELDPAIPVLITSGYSHETLAQDLAGGPRTSFLQKPYNPSALLLALEKLRL